MFAKLFKVSVAVLAVVALSWSIGGVVRAVRAQGCCGGGQHGAGHANHAGMMPSGSQHGMSCRGSAGHGHADASGMPGCHSQAGRSEPMPHGGQSVCQPPFVFELVFHSKEIRVYAYRPWPKPRSLLGVQGTVSLKPLDAKQVTRVALKYVAARGGEQDYLVATADIGHAKERNLLATIRLQDRAATDSLTAEFTRAVNVSEEAKSAVTLAKLDRSDDAGIARQEVCPVTGAKLGSMGDPIKVLIDGKPLYLCCQGCVAKVKSAPETYLRKVEQSHENH